MAGGTQKVLRRGSFFAGFYFHTRHHNSLKDTTTIKDTMRIQPRRFKRRFLLKVFVQFTSVKYNHSSSTRVKAENPLI